MSATTVFLGRLIGLYLIAISVGMLANRRRTLAAFDEMAPAGRGCCSPAWSLPPRDWRSCSGTMSGAAGRSRSQSRSGLGGTAEGRHAGVAPANGSHPSTRASASIGFSCLDDRCAGDRALGDDVAFGWL